jgi:hypothetical protein
VSDTEEYQEKVEVLNENQLERWQEAANDRDSLRDDVASAFKETVQKIEHEREFEAALDERHELRERGGGSLPKIVEGYAKLHQWGKQDPRAAAEWTADWALKQPEVTVKPREASKSDDSGVRHIQDDVRDAFRAVKENEADRAALKTLKELAPGQSPVATLKEINKFDRALREDPIGTVARHAARAGVPVLPHQQEREAQAQSFQGFIDEVSSSGVLPNFRQLEGQIADILEDRNFPRSGDPKRDLFVAYEFAEKLTVAAASKKAAVSPKGSGPSSGARSNSSTGRSVGDDVRAALAEMGGI